MSLAKRKTLILASLAALAWLMAAPVQAGEPVNLVFKDRAKVIGPEVKMKHILASISGASPQLARRIKETVVAQSPPPGQTKRLGSSAITSQLNYKNLGINQIQAQLPPHILVSRGCHKISPEKMADIFRQAVHDNLTWVPEKVAVDNIKTPKELILPPGQLDIQPHLDRPGDMPGRITVKLGFYVDGQQVADRSLTGQVKFFQKMVVATGPLARGTVLTKADLRVIRLQVLRGADRQFNSIRDVVGLKLKRSIGAGQPIRNNQVAKPILVKRGDKVTLVAQKGRLTVTAAGIVRASKATLGEQIKVLNLSTRREVYGQVVSPTRVKVFF